MEKSPDIDSFTDPLMMMLEQSVWALRNAIRRRGTDEEEKFILIYEHYEKEIEKHLEGLSALD